MINVIVITVCLPLPCLHLTSSLRLSKLKFTVIIIVITIIEKLSVDVPLGFPASSSYNFTSVAHNQRFSVTIIDAHNMQQAMPVTYSI